MLSWDILKAKYIKEPCLNTEVLSIASDEILENNVNSESNLKAIHCVLSSSGRVNELHSSNFFACKLVLCKYWTNFFNICQSAPEAQTP